MICFFFPLTFMARPLQNQQSRNQNCGMPLEMAVGARLVSVLGTAVNFWYQRVSESNFFSSLSVIAVGSTPGTETCTCRDSESPPALWGWMHSHLCSGMCLALGDVFQFQNRIFPIPTWKEVLLCSY